MAVATDELGPLDSRLGILTIASAGGLYGVTPGSTLSKVPLASVLKSVTISENLVEAARRAEIVLDNTESDYTASVMVGSRITLGGWTLVPTLGAVADNRTIFTGKVFLDSRHDESSTSDRSFTAYDALTMLARSEDTLSYVDKTLSQVVNDVLAKNGLPAAVLKGSIPSNKLGRLFQAPGQKCWSVITEALDRAYRTSGKRCTVRENSTGTGVELVELGNDGTEWVLSEGLGGLITGVDVVEDAEDIAARLLIAAVEEDPLDQTKRVTNLAVRTAGGNIASVFGNIKRVVGPDSSTQTAAETTAQANAEATNIFKTKISARVDSLLIPGVRRGNRVQVLSESAPPVRWYIDAATHTYEADSLSMSIELIKL